MSPVLQRIKNVFLERSKKVAPVMASIGMLALAVCMMAGNVAAAPSNATGYYYGYSMIVWLFGILSVLFAVAFIWLRDFRILIVTLATVVITLLAVWLGL